MATRTTQLAQAAGLNVYEDMAYGRLNGIFLNASINNYNGMVSIITFIKRESGIDTKEIESFITQNKDEYKNARPSFDEQTLSITIPNYIKLSIDTIADILSELTVFLSGRGYYSGCVLCDNTDYLGVIVKDGVIMEACPECQNKLEGAATELALQRSETGSYAKGAIGAILGGIIGIIPWLILDAFGYISAVCGLIMAYLSFKGYQLLKGRKGKGMVFIIGAVLIVFTFFAIIISQTLNSYNSFIGDKSSLSILDLFKAELVSPFTNATSYFGEYYLNPDLGAIWTGLGLGWFFAALGSAVLLKNIFHICTGKDIEVKRLKQDEDALKNTAPKE